HCTSGVATSAAFPPGAPRLERLCPESRSRSSYPKYNSGQRADQEPPTSDGGTVSRNGAGAERPRSVEMLRSGVVARVAEAEKQVENGRQERQAEPETGPFAELSGEAEVEEEPGDDKPQNEDPPDGLAGDLQEDDEVADRDEAGPARLAGLHKDLPLRDDEHQPDPQADEPSQGSRRGTGRASATAILVLQHQKRKRRDKSCHASVSFLVPGETSLGDSMPETGSRQQISFRPPAQTRSRSSRTASRSPPGPCTRTFTRVPGAPRRSRRASARVRS